MRRGFLIRVAVAAAFAPIGLAHADVIKEEPFSFDAAPGRLPKDVVPLVYDVAITPDAKKHIIHGSESIALEVRKATSIIQFNTLNEALDHVLVDGKPVKHVATDNKQQLTTITLAAPLSLGHHTLAFGYTGKIESHAVGLFAQEYVDPAGVHGVMLTTQFEATDARRMFPSWDEPAFRAQFKLTATVPAAWETVSNMPIATRTVHGALATTSFEVSPKMPSYLVEFSAGNLAHISATSGGTVFNVWAVKGQENDGTYALGNAQQILADYNDYFGFPFPLPKLDSIAVPGGFTGAMENWGAITYNDQILLLNASSTVGQRQSVYSVQAHEMAHQWNGDLVTMGWWDNLWLNESFASWRAAKETDLRNPSWNWWENEDGDKEFAMDNDARVNSHAIQQHVTNELEATNAFDPAITYSKGEAVLRMLEAYLGDDVFRDGIRKYMKARAFSNATSTDLWIALSQASGRDVRAFAADWTEQPGFPLVSVTAQCDANGARTISLSQQRFLLSGSDAAGLRWKVPLQIRSGADGAPQSLLLEKDGQSAPAGRCDEPLSVNANTIGYFRAGYDAATLATNTRLFGTLKNGDRIALLDDQWALVESGKQDLSSFLALASGMGDDLDERAWEKISGALETIEHDERGTPGHAAYLVYARSVLKPLASHLGWDARADETPGVQRLRRSVLEDLGSWGDPETIAEAKKRFVQFVADRSAIKPDDQHMILSVVARSADAATFEQLHAVARSHKNETELRRYYTPLMLVADEGLAQQAGKIALSDEIPKQAEDLRLQLIAVISEAHPKLSWELLTANLDRLLAPHQPMGPMILATGIPEIFWNTLSPDELDSWLKAHTPAETAPLVARGVETARFKVAEKTALDTQADRFIAGQSQH